MNSLREDKPKLSLGENSAGSLRKRLIAALFVAIGTAIVLVNWLLQALASPQTGWDFPVFYIAGKLPIHLLYDRAAFAAVWQHDLAPLGVPHWAAYVRPSVFALLLHPLASIPYGHALWLWMSAGLCAYLAAVGLLVHKFRLPSFFLPACAAFFPALAGIISGQDTAVYLLAFVVAMILLDRGRDALAGAVLVLCLCKFNLAMLVPLVLLAHRRYQALLSFSLGAVGIAAISFSLTPFRSYVSAIAHAQSDTPGFYPVGLRGFSVAIGQPWCYLILAALVGAVCVWLIIRLPLNEGMCIAITGALLISPYITWYDSTLLVIPLAVLSARANPALRWTSLAVLAAIPLWEHGGGNNGPIGFMHVAVEGLVLVVFASSRRLLRYESTKTDPERTRLQAV